MRNEIDFAKSAKALYELFPHIKPEFEIMQQVIHLHREFKPQTSIGDVVRKTRLQIFSECFFELKSVTQISNAVDIPKQKVRDRIKSINKLNPVIEELNDFSRPKFFVKSRDTVENSATHYFDNSFYRVCFIFRNAKFHSDSNDFLYDGKLKSFSNILDFDKHKNVKKLKEDFFNSISNPGVLYMLLKHWFYDKVGCCDIHNAFWTHKEFLKDPVTYFEGFEFETIQGELKTEMLNRFLKDVYHWRNPFTWGDIRDPIKSRERAENALQKIETELMKRKLLTKKETWIYRESLD